MEVIQNEKNYCFSKRNWLEIVAIVLSTAALIFLRNSLNHYGNLLMVWITILYVIATIEICLTNMNAVKTTQDQLTESKRQYEETKRLEYMPCFEIHFDKIEAGTGTSIDLTDKQTGVIHTLFTKYRIENISRGTAINVKCIVKSAIKITELITCPIVPAQKDKSINCSILADKGYFTDNSLPFSIAIYYEDIMNNHYEQNMELEFIEDNPRWIWVKSVGAPQLNNEGVQHV